MERRVYISVVQSQVVSAGHLHMNKNKTDLVDYIYIHIYIHICKSVYVYVHITIIKHHEFGVDKDCSFVSWLPRPE